MIPIEYQDMYNTATIILSFVVGWVSKHYAEIYAQSKNKISSIRKLIDHVDDALVDDAVSDQEFVEIFNHAKEVIQK